MRFALILLFLIFNQNGMIIFGHEEQTSSKHWKIVNDTVMGGRSDSKVQINDADHLVFSGHVSLENNGGFAMCQYHFDQVDVSSMEKFIVKVKGDGKNYQFRAKASEADSHSYIYSFKTTGDWQTIEIPFNKMVPSFRGRKLDMPNYKGEKLEMVAFLIGNKKEQNFQLEVENIKVN